MTVQAVLLPVFAQVALTFFLLFWMGAARYRTVASGQVRAREIALREPGWPAEVAQIGNAYHNQLELPLLFYVLTILALMTRKADLLFVIMAWLFVLARFLHVTVHVTTNRLARRFSVFVAGAIILLAMWIVFALRLLLDLW